MAACMLLSTPLRAAAEEEPEPEHVLSLDEVVITGTRTPYRIDEAPVPTQVIRREEILATGGDNVTQILDQIPGLYVRRNDEFRLGGNTVRMQGADPNKVAILLNGRRFRGGVDGVVDLRDIPAANVERIEIIRGPASSLYGSDAMGGVINIITTQPSSEPTFDAAIAGGNFGRVLGRVSHGYQLGPVGYFVSYQHDEIQLAQQYNNDSAQFAGEAADSKQTRDDLYGQLDYEVVPGHTLSLIGDWAPVREGPLSNRENVTLGGGYDAKLTPDTSASTDVNLYYFDRQNILPGFEEDLHFREWDYGLRGLHSVTQGLWGEQHQISLGYRFNDEQLRAAGRTVASGDGSLYLPDVDARTYMNSPYVQDEIRLGKRWSVVLGTSVDVHSEYGAEVNPRGTVSWRPHDDYRLALTVGRGFRAPDLLQLYDRDFNNIGAGRNSYVILGNPNLNAETDVAVNITGEAQPFDGLRLTVDLYRHDFRNLIGVSLMCFRPPSGADMCTPGFENPFPGVVSQVFQFQNVRKAVTQGVELGVRLDLFHLLWPSQETHVIRFDLGYGYLYSRNEGGIPGEDGNELPLRPPHRVLPGVTYAQRDWGTEIHWFGEYESDTYTDLANSEDFVARNHWLWNFHVEQRLKPIVDLLPLSGATKRAAEGLSLFSDGYNVFDTEYGPFTLMGEFAGHATFLAGVSFEW